MPELMPENITAYFIYSVVSGQLIVGPGGPVDISHDAIHRAMELYNVEDKLTCFERVTHLARHMISLQQEKMKAKQNEFRHRISRR